MPFVLTTASTITCPGAGTVSPAGRPKLTVGGKPVVRPDGVKGTSVSGCKTPTNSNTPTKTCTTVASVEGAATKLTVDGAAVALDTLKGATDGTPGSLTVAAKQTKLKAV